MCYIVTKATLNKMKKLLNVLSIECHLQILLIVEDKFAFDMFKVLSRFGSSFFSGEWNGHFASGSRLP